MNLEITEIKKNGQKYVLMPYIDYEKIMEILEDAEDLADAKIARNNNEEKFPAKLVYEIIEGKNPILAFREYRGLTQAQLAKKANFSRNYINEIENGKKRGSIKALKAIADALEVQLDDLI